jgi:hypothetical protein
MIALTLRGTSSLGLFGRRLVGRDRAVPRLASTLEPAEWSSWTAADQATFLRDFWQQRPLLVRGAFPALASAPAAPPELLAELACEPDAASRLVRGDVVQHGPLDPEAFEALEVADTGASEGDPAEEWALL